MTIFIYDGTFEGLLTLVNEVREMKTEPERISTFSSYQETLWDSRYDVFTDEEKCNNIWHRINDNLPDNQSQLIYRVFLSEMQGIEMLIFRFINKILDTPYSVTGDFGDNCVLETHQIFKKVSREAERIRMFARFQEIEGEMFFAPIEPKYNVLPLVLNHFKNRYPLQNWLIYDMKRKYGFYHTAKEILQIKLENSKMNSINGKAGKKVLSADEIQFQQLWLSYLDSVTIKERRNLRLQMQHMPKRFWKFLTEKNTEAICQGDILQV
ncbi:MAG: TIGR03915 family putative DNA repair protein [Lentimicrobiaceae bacterium]|jgi:probable DNA metabolism protein|nr:TIGR03915 family putative DNA repair protein [Lentimicrobiaceae bacterium]